MNDRDDPVGLTQALVRIASENPTGRETEISAFVAQWLRDLPGVEADLQEVEPGRSNVIARIGPAGGAPALAYIAHMDTVPVGDGWSRDPFGGQVEGGNLYGRGSCDMKAGLASAMTAFAGLARSGSPLRRGMAMCATVDEEGPLMKGAVALAEAGLVGPETLIVAPEPSNLELIVSHKGLIWFEVECHGRLAHAGNPREGVDAIRGGAAFVRALDTLVDELPHNHPLVGPATATFSAFNGGIKTNVVPNFCRIEVDLRLPTPMVLDEARDLVGRAARQAEAAVPGLRVEFRQINNNRPPIDAEQTGELVGALGAAIRDTTGRKAVVAGFPAYTDASIIAANTGNRNGIVFGPGRLAQAHTVDEYVPVEQIEAAAKVLTRTALKLCAEP